MYTQCPDCDIAFKVTAEVLKQAAGMVRCGSCGTAFNSLEYLSEQMPDQPVRKETDIEIPELKPESTRADTGLPKSISAEQSAALLKTLDELAGSDIRIEDTGVEWRVLDEDEASVPAADDDDANLEPQLETVDEFLDDDPTPVDEFLTATPNIIDSPEFFTEESAASKTAVEELRFDDNTPLPDDFDLDDESVYTPLSTAENIEVDEDAADESHAQEPPADIALSEPDEWTDILGEFEELVTAVETPVDMRADADVASDLEDETDSSDEAVEENSVDQLLDMDTQFALQAEAMGIDLSGIEQIDDIDNLGELEGADQLDDELDDLEELEQVEEPDELEELGELEELDALEALDESNELDDLEELEALEDLQDPEEIDESDELEDLEGLEELEELDETALSDLEQSADDARQEPELDDVIAQLGLLDDDNEADNLDEELIDEPVIASHQIEAELAASSRDSDDDAIAADDQDIESSDEHYVPPMTEEEHTVNMQIDQDLMALAIEDEDGFASTIIIPDEDAENMVRTESATDKSPSVGQLEGESGFETIIMEGEFVRSALDSEKLAADAAAAAEMAAIARAKAAEENSSSSGKRYGMIAAAITLVLLLATQVIHQSREALATIPAFSNSIGQVYRALGQPVQPAWDITGWRIEASNDTIQVEEGEENLTVYSRIGNNSKRPMPYPLVSISLTDRLVDTLGNRVLGPAEYLPTDLDPRKLVEPGNTFNAVIVIKSPPKEASGYKIDVCYRVTNEKLRCKAEDAFK